MPGQQPQYHPTMPQTFARSPHMAPLAPQAPQVFNQQAAPQTLQGFQQTSAGAHHVGPVQSYRPQTSPTMPGSHFQMQFHPHALPGAQNPSAGSSVAPVHQGQSWPVQQGQSEGAGVHSPAGQPQSLPGVVLQAPPAQQAQSQSQSGVALQASPVHQQQSQSLQGVVLQATQAQQQEFQSLQAQQIQPQTLPDVSAPQPVGSRAQETPLGQQPPLVSLLPGQQGPAQHSEASPPVHQQVTAVPENVPVEPSDPPEPSQSTGAHVAEIIRRNREAALARRRLLQNAEPVAAAEVGASQGVTPTEVGASEGTTATESGATVPSSQIQIGASVEGQTTPDNETSDLMCVICRAIGETKQDRGSR